jgi:PST family polysaccharide transporter
MGLIARAYKSSLVQNTFFLFLNKGINAVVPIVLIPFCNNIFGVEQYGSLIYAQASLGLLIIFSDYSFSVSGPRDISANFNNLTKVSSILSSIYTIKIVLSLVGFLILFLIPFFFSNKPNFNFHLFLIVYLALLLQSFLPFWFFQGMRSNHFITSINFFSKIFFLFLVYFVAFHQKSIIWIPFFEMIAYVIALTASLIVLFKNFKVKFYIARLKEAINHFKDGWNIFLVILIYWLINGGSILFVNYYCSQEELGYFSVFSRISYYLFAIFQPVIFAVVPYMTEKFSNGSKDALIYFKKIFKYFVTGTLVVVTTLLLLSNQLFHQFFNQSFNTNLPKYLHSYYLLIIWVFFLLINNFMAMQLLIGNKKDKIFRRYLFYNGLFVLIGFFILIPLYKGMGAAIAMLLGECLFFVLMFTYYNKINRKLNHISLNKILTNEISFNR